MNKKFYFYLLVKVNEEILYLSSLITTGTDIARTIVSNYFHEYTRPRFISADKYVFINPMYNLFIPAEMKSYFDLVMQVLYTFEYTPEGNPQGVLKNKKAIHLSLSQ
ncbi:NAD(P)H-dependent oxidoreductase [Sporolactobacillus vineae]|uniref:NAD(P)H-dependent oxidoreductase n=1 Tax=Sporolactobacillus vineae TaxID=444463 RepID=UPI000289F75A|nr:NAD(P)H-dependent oxidoreductase [Sporolactobacillus vineae]